VKVYVCAVMYGLVAFTVFGAIAPARIHAQESESRAKGPSILDHVNAFLPEYDRRLAKAEGSIATLDHGRRRERLESIAREVRSWIQQMSILTTRSLAGRQRFELTFLFMLTRSTVSAIERSLPATPAANDAD
jgi:hypothetical protein